MPILKHQSCTRWLDSPGGEGDGGSIFWKTREIGLPSYSKICALWVGECRELGKWSGEASRTKTTSFGLSKEGQQDKFGGRQAFTHSHNPATGVNKRGLMSSRLT